MGAIELAPGVTIGARYRLEHRLGEGGMGVIWAAEDIATGGRCALKLMKDADGEPAARKRFLREGRAASAVRHPNVVGIFDVIEPEGGPPAIAMELLEGESLRTRLERDGALSLEALADIMVPVISAVGEAHSLGIVHRDLKPENIFLARGPDGECNVKVLDFGVAKLTELDGEALRSSGIKTGAVLGTPAYMAPEQVFAEADLDHRADVWALGVIFYECLSGICPTRGDNVGQILKHVVARPFEPLDELVPDLPEEIARLVARMLARERRERPASLHEVLELLEPFASVPEVPFGLPVTPASREVDRTADRLASARRGWTWRCTVESVEAGAVSVLALVETAVASAVYGWIAWRFGTLHLAISACVAPLLLLRTPRSVALALSRFHARFRPEPHHERHPNLEGKPIPYGSLFKLAAGISFVGTSFLLMVVMPFGLVMSLRHAAPVIAIRVFSTLATAATRPLESVSEIPRNWWRSIATIDSGYPLEMLPGAYRRYGSDSYDVQTDIVLVPLRGAASLLRDFRGVDLAARSIGILVLPSLAAVFLCVALCYRWSMKGSALIYSPLVWIVRGATKGSLRSRLQDIHELFYHRLLRGFAVLVLLLFSAKAYLYYAWSELEPSWHAIPGRELLDAVVMPEAFPPWQIAVAINAILAWVLYCVADWAAVRWRRGEQIDELTLETVLHWSSLVRGALSIYAIACGIYIAASLSSSFELPPIGTRILPWL